MPNLKLLLRYTILEAQESVPNFKLLLHCAVLNKETLISLLDNINNEEEIPKNTETKVNLKCQILSYNITLHNFRDH